METYELLFILRPDIGEEQLDEEIGKIGDLIGESRGEVKDKDDWGKRELAYEINGVEEGFYHIWQIALPTNDVAFLKRSLNMNENVLRFLLTKDGS